MQNSVRARQLPQEVCFARPLRRICLATPEPVFHVAGNGVWVQDDARTYSPEKK